MPDNIEALAQALADKINPPYTDYRKRNLPLDNLKELYPDREDWYEHVEVRKGPDDAPYVTFTASDGYPSFRAASYREIAEAAVDVLFPVVRSVEELKALPVGTIVLVHSKGEEWAWTKVDDIKLSPEDEDYADSFHVGTAWACVAYKCDWLDSSLFQIADSITVLHRP